MSTVIEMMFSEAQQEATNAFHACKPTPMIVGKAENLFSNKIIPGTEEVIEGGLCGFAWINIKPARGPFVKWLKSNNIGSPGTYGGYTISSYESTPTGNSQSMQRKEAGCRAFVNKVKETFPEMKIWVETRID